MANHLAGETSPYLRQHADNPVDWYPWGEAAFAEARRRDVPIFLSVGYSTCHWCHVMAHESFEDEATAAQLNAGFVPVKVDREERPDVDAVHMTAAQLMGVGGGWPLSVFLTPEGLPFFGGTYWPPRDLGEMPAFRRVLAAVTRAWQAERPRVADGAAQVAAAVRHALTPSGDAAAPDVPDLPARLAAAVDALAGRFDGDHGGFGGAPKFPQVSVLLFLLRHHRRTGDPRALAMVETTARAMAAGGIHDQLGGGFARYAVDARWEVPHFEKMLSDNAQLVELYADLATITGNAEYADVARGAVGWLVREMRAGDAGVEADGAAAFAAALDADSEGAEGRFYVWTLPQLVELLGAEDAALAAEHFGVTDPGLFEGANVLRIAAPAEELAARREIGLAQTRLVLQAARASLLAARAGRVRPHRDDKVIAAWNGLAIHALARAGRQLGEPDWVDLAAGAARFVLAAMRAPDGTLARTWNDGVTRGRGMLEDHAAMARGLISLYQATGAAAWLGTAADLARVAREAFGTENGTGFHDAPAAASAADAGPTLFARPRDPTDGASPSGKALMAEVLALLGTYQYDDALLAAAHSALASAGELPWLHPQAGGFHLAVAERLAQPARELVIAGDPSCPEAVALRDAAFRAGDPLLVIGYSGGPAAGSPAHAMLVDRPLPAGERAAAFVCRDRACLPPVTDPASLAALLASG